LPPAGDKEKKDIVGLGTSNEPGDKEKEKKAKKVSDKIASRTITVKIYFYFHRWPNSVKT